MQLRLFSLYYKFLLEFSIIFHFESERPSLFGSCGFDGIQPSPYSLICNTILDLENLECHLFRTHPYLSMLFHYSLVCLYSLIEFLFHSRRHSYWGNPKEIPFSALHKLSPMWCMASTFSQHMASHNTVHPYSSTTLNTLLVSSSHSSYDFHTTHCMTSSHHPPYGTPPFSIHPSPTCFCMAHY